MIQCSVESVKSNLFPEPLIGEYDQVENQIRTKGNRGKGDLHISRSLCPWVVEPGQLENVGKYGLEEKKSFREKFNPQSPPPKKKLKMKVAPNRSDRPTEFSVSCIAGKSELL